MNFLECMAQASDEVKAMVEETNSKGVPVNLRLNKLTPWYYLLSVLISLCLEIVGKVVGMLVTTKAIPMPNSCP